MHLAGMTSDAPALAPRGGRTTTLSEITPSQMHHARHEDSIDMTLFDEFAGVKLERQSDLTEFARAGNS
jgi:hypothetical protein